MHRLDPLFAFRSVAVVGASESSYGSAPFRSLKDLGFDGKYWPVNPRRESLHGVRCYPSPTDIPEPIDAAVIVVGREQVLPSVEACAGRGARTIVIISAGFAEADERGRSLQEQLTAFAGEHGLLVVGPNCFGIASVVNRCAGFVGSGLDEARQGKVGVISHSGGLLNEVVSYGVARGIGFSHLASLGNEAGVTAADVLDYMVGDSSTEVILAILETVRDPELFVRAADRAAAAGKPIVVLKIGASEKAAASALTHTAALSGSDAVHRALFRQKGITRVDDLDELVECGVLFSGAVSTLRQRPLERAAVIEISGGGKGLVCDTAAAAGVELPDLGPSGVDALRPYVPPRVEVSNPLDTGGSWGTQEMDRTYPTALRVFASEPDVDIIVSRFTIPRAGQLGVIRQRLDEMHAAQAEHPDRLFVVLARTSDQFCEEWARAVRDEGVVFLQGYGRGMRALGRLAQYSRFVRRRRERTSIERGQAACVLGEVTVPASGSLLGEVEAKDLLRRAGLPVVATARARTSEEAVRLADEYGYPVVAKVLSPQIVHKSDVGGVRLNLGDAEAVRDAFAQFEDLVASMPGAEFEGVAIQPMARPGLEVAMGANRDPQFGPVIMFGLGGVFVEVLHDVALRVAPISELDAHDMLEEVRGAQLLQGMRGRPPVDRAALVQMLCRLSDLMLANPSIASVDINPVIAYPDGVLAVDARIALHS